MFIVFQPLSLDSVCVCVRSPIFNVLRPPFFLHRSFNGFCVAYVLVLCFLFRSLGLVFVLIYGALAKLS